MVSKILINDFLNKRIGPAQREAKLVQIAWLHDSWRLRAGRYTPRSGYAPVLRTFD